MISILKNELATGDYTGMTDAEVATALNAENITYERDSLMTGEIGRKRGLEIMARSQSS